MAWHNEPALQTKMRQFHDRNCCPPTDAMNSAKAKLMAIVRGILEPKLKQKGYCDNLVYCGSSYQGLKVANDNLEWDIDLVIRRKDVRAVPESRGGYHVQLQSPQGAISGQEMRRKFQGYLWQLQSEVPDLRSVTFHDNKAAVQMDVKNQHGSLWFQVDLVPTIEIGSGSQLERYVCKYVPADKDYTWCRSFAEEECRYFDRIDGDDNGCRKQAGRVLKYLRNNEAGLKKLSSYHLKALLMWDIKQEPSKSWRHNELGSRVMQLLVRLERALRDGNLPHPFLHGCNLLEQMDPMVRGNLQGRIKTLINSQHQVEQILAR